MIKKQLIRPIGMMQDNLITSPKSNQYAHEIKNLRFNTQGDYVTASWSTEQGTLKLSIEGIDNDYLINQIPVGQAVINDGMILFTTSTTNLHVDRIIRFEYKNPTTLTAFVLYEGNIALSAEHPLETLTFYENDNIQKVYWTDGINQPRMINVAVDTPYTTSSLEVDCQFDFVKEVGLKEEVTVTKQQGGAGQFPPCTVKYAITYYNKYGQESNIVWTSDLLYPTKGERGLKEDELSGDIFVVKVNNVDTTHKFDYIRLYSIIRTTNNSIPVVRIVENKSLKDNPSTVVFNDSNTTGDIIDPAILNYIGGVKITAKTFEQKNNTLFFGNITLQTKSLKGLTESANLDWSSPIDTPGVQYKGFLIDEYYKNIKIAESNTGFYPYKNQLNNDVSVRHTIGEEGTRDSYENIKLFTNPKVFKYNEWYRFGVQCQDKNGIWSDVIWLGDAQDTLQPISSVNYKRFPVYKYTIKKNTAITLTNNGYKKARLVCCYTTNNDRSVLAQGVLCPTVYNGKWQENHSPDYVGSWFYRFQNEIGNTIDNEIQSTLSLNDLGNIVSKFFPKKKGKHIFEPESISGEDIQRESSFYCTDSMVTFHSPDLEFDDSIKTLDWSGLKLRTVGTVTVNSIAAKTYLDYIKQAQDFLGNKGKGLQDNSFIGTSAAELLRKTSYWNDIDVYNANLSLGKANSKKGQTDYLLYDYPIYPFQRKYLNNYMGDLERPVVVNNGSDYNGFLVEESSVIESKIYSELYSSNSTEYNIPADLRMLDCQLFDSTETIPLKIKGSNGNLIYYGNIDTIAPVSSELWIKTPIFEYQGLFKENNPYGEKPTIPDINGCEQDEDNIIKWFKGSYLVGNLNKVGGVNNMYIGVTSDPIRIAYKSTPHCAINMIDDIPNLSNNNSLHLVELYREVTEAQRFGGTSEDALKNNVFIPCGAAVNLEQYEDSGYSSIRKDVVLIGDTGDSYYMRYDNLKTYPYSRIEVNGIVEIMSFMCETRVNLDGRSDKNRGLTDNTLIDNTNFNYINKSYTQSDNYFNYRVLDDTSSRLDNFPNQITWTKMKNAGEEVDSWTNITLASVADAEGTLGEITKIVNNRDNLYMFQKHGFAVLGYNEKTALSTTNGVPLEIANSGKFSGFQYISKSIGCQNKWSVNNSKEYLLWIDDSNRQLYKMSSEGMQPLSTLNGFDSFLINNLEGRQTEWNPLQFNTNDVTGNFITYYDNLSKDIYYINNDYCLTYNELTGTFTSFYDYNRVPYIADISKHCVMLYLNGDNIEFYAARENDKYNNFFGSDKPYWITLLTNGGTDEKGSYTNSDKVFNTIEYRGDLFDKHSPVLATPRTDIINNNVPNITNMINMPLFTDIAAYNGYQAYKEFRIDGRTTYEYPWKAERKFNMWRVIIPRATYNNPDGTLYTSHDRLRNMFAYIKLINNEPGRPLDYNLPNGTENHRAVFGDFIVSFDVK